MGIDYGSYLIIILLLVLAIPTILFVVFRRRNIRSGIVRRPVTVTGGNISIFFDKAGNVTIIPYIKDKYGNGKATSKVETVKIPYTPDKLGHLVKSSLNGCKESTPCTNRELLDKLEATDWKQFSEGRRNISLYFREGYGLVFNTTTRKPDGAYQFNLNGAEKTIPSDTGNAVLGSTLLELLGKCR